jgi:hypothetical protein
MRPRWLAILLLAFAALTVSGCASSRSARYGPNGRYIGYSDVYGHRHRGIYNPRYRDYRWEREQRRRAAWLRQQQRRLERYERRRDHLAERRRR